MVLALDARGPVAGRDGVALDGVVGAVAVVLELVGEDLGAEVVARPGRGRAGLGQARLVDVRGGVLERVGRAGALAQGRVDGVVAAGARRSARRRLARSRSRATVSSR